MTCCSIKICGGCYREFSGISVFRRMLFALCLVFSSQHVVNAAFINVPARPIGRVLSNLGISDSISDPLSNVLIFSAYLVLFYKSYKFIEKYDEARVENKKKTNWGRKKKLKVDYVGFRNVAAFMLFVISLLGLVGIRIEEDDYGYVSEEEEIPEEIDYFAEVEEQYKENNMDPIIYCAKRSQRSLIELPIKKETEYGSSKEEEKKCTEEEEKQYILEENYSGEELYNGFFDGDDPYFPVMRYYVNDKNCSIDAEENGYKPIHIACSQGSIGVVDFLISKGADIDDPTTYKIVEEKEDKDEFDSYDPPLSCLHISCFKENENVAKFLIEKGADIRFRANPSGMSIFSLCCWKNLFEICKLIASKGVEIKEGDNDGNTPISWAIRSGNLEIVKWLHEKKGVKIESSNSYGLTSILAACKSGDLDMVKYVEKKCREEHKTKLDKDGNSPLHYACLSGNEDIVQFLIEKSHPINILNNNCQTPFYVACLFGIVEVVKYLLNLSKEKGINLDFPKGMIDTLLEELDKKKEWEIIEILQNMQKDSQKNQFIFDNYDKKDDE